MRKGVVNHIIHLSAKGVDGVMKCRNANPNVNKIIK